VIRGRAPQPFSASSAGETDSPRGVIKNSLKLFPEALADFNQALKLNPDNGGIHLGRGISKFYLGDKTGACEDWRMASTRGATNAAALITEYCKE